jgi:hypothetical protein
MAAEQPSRSPIDQLVELLVYAPVGLLYEYQEVLPKLVKRGRSQVQLARLLSQIAANQARSDGPATGAGAATGDAANVAWSILARAITELGAAVGLAPARTTANAAADSATAEPSEIAPLPVAGYDSLTAREIIVLLDDLSATQRSQIKEHEAAHRGRKTILAKLDQLQA